MRDLYDFKTENEWPKRAINARRGNTWISKSSSEEERASLSIRRNSQDLEFNDRMNVIKVIIVINNNKFLYICFLQFRISKKNITAERHEGSIGSSNV